MNDYYCPAGKCFCRSINWIANCNGVAIDNANSCIRPERKSVLTEEQIKIIKPKPCPFCNSCFLAGRGYQSEIDIITVRDMLHDYDTGNKRHAECRRMIGRVIAVLIEAVKEEL